MSANGQEKIYQMVTKQIIRLLENGTIPWRKPWVGGGKPANLRYKRPYRGLNTFVLSAVANNAGFDSKWWLTFNQVQELGGGVKKGARGTTVTLWKPVSKQVEDPETGEVRERSFPILRFFSVFNLNQVSGIPDPDSNADPVDHKPLQEASEIAARMPNPPQIEEGPQPCYIPRWDTVRIPQPGRFDQSEEFYSTLYHELVHSTGHKSRLARDAVNHAQFDRGEYSREELVAEMGSAFLCGHAGITQPVIENQAAYIHGWLNVLREDSRMVIKAAGAAQRAADYILGHTEQTAA
ncbi:MAG: ssDNA-binding domain-containing protein [Desulfohalobiaceae bacterium]|nr:ssDNA-binding domain-containing protein [Desulfohalobiaceae bacterium]